MKQKRLSIRSNKPHNGYSICRGERILEGGFHSRESAQRELDSCREEFKKR